MKQLDELPSAVKVLEDVSQQSIIEKRRKLRELKLKQIGQRTSLIERDIERLAQLTR
ncbi:hypothetical protein [Paenibacillus methanolicus]|uniref:Uncharacterized protein n=1 Tax=Paenibacillus methanolicus TaxID=582686 RepID=A0A5S5CIC5_9BACL|nr:hypothetical protein [Paenibacillus methanolicus]TYP78252.1 hypothetical protein BCM02_102829 [Paenibacillus methanolicus]